MGVQIDQIPPRVAAMDPKKQASALARVPRTHVVSAACAAVATAVVAVLHVAGAPTSWVAAASIVTTAVVLAVGSLRTQHFPFLSLLVIIAGGWVVRNFSGSTLFSSACGVSAGVLVAVVVWHERRKRQASTAAKIAAALAEITSDSRPPGQQITTLVSPFRWHPPAPVDAGTVEKIMARLSGVVGSCSGRVDTGTGTVLVHVPAEALAEQTDSPATMRERLAAALSHQVGAPVMLSDTLDDDTMKPTTMRWEPKSTARLADETRRILVQRTCEVMLGCSVSIEWHFREDAARITFPVPPPDFVAHPPRPASVPPLALPFAAGPDGQTVTWSLENRPHMLIDGTTGGGKTVLLRTLIVAALQAGSGVDRLVMIDPKRVGLMGWEHHDAVTKVTSPESMHDMITMLHDEMKRRYREIQTEKRTREQLERWVVIVDEGEELIEELQEHWRTEVFPILKLEADEAKKRKEAVPQPPKDSPAADQINSFLRLAREAGMHMVLASQQVSTGWISTGARGNFGIRATMGSLEETSLKMIMGSAADQVRHAVTHDDHVRGRAWVAIGQTPVRCQIYFTPDPMSVDPSDTKHLVSLLGD